MFLKREFREGWKPGFPRIRGDVPFIELDFSDFVVFSPHTRGCSGVAETCTVLFEVFPAYAGMFLR